MFGVRAYDLGLRKFRIKDVGFGAWHFGCGSSALGFEVFSCRFQGQGLGRKAPKIEPAIIRQRCLP